MNGMVTGVLLNGTKVGNKRMTLRQVHFHLKVWMSVSPEVHVGVTRSPKRSEWVKMNLDTGAAVNTVPLNFAPDGVGDGRFNRSASGERTPDAAAWQFSRI